jgi:enoyl-CoA hydratase/carnithine racemase
MTDYQHLLVAEAGSIVTVQLDRPAASNALDPLPMRELTAFVRAFRTRSDVRVIILRGSETYFSAGADLNSVEDRRFEKASLLATRAGTVRISRRVDLALQLAHDETHHLPFRQIAIPM